MPVMFITKSELAKQREKIPFPRDFKLLEHIRESGRDRNGNLVYEFIGTDSFGAEWQVRQRFEVEAGRAEEPIVYTPLYEIVNDSSLPKNVSVNQLGPGGVILEEVYEGGEVKFSHITSSEFTVPIRHWATGLEYSKDLIIFNELWRIPIMERAVGVAYNALLNHIHLNPIISATYTGDNQTAANTSGTTLVEDYMLTLEDAITNSREDSTNPRRGPYVLLINGAQQFNVEKALQRVPQQGVTVQSSAISQISSVIAYDGWSGVRGAKTVSYAGVTSGKAYLISQQYRGQDFMSFMKQDLLQSEPETDISRFLTQVVWDLYFGVYTNVLRATEEITWPS